MTDQKSFFALQNGSDIRGVSLGEEATLGPAQVGALAAAFVRLLCARLAKEPARLRVAVGHDSRLTARQLTGAVLEAIAQAGSFGTNFGLCSTPAMFLSTRFSGLEYDGAIMLTASHMPSDRNGMKFFDRQGGLEKADILTLLQDAWEHPADGVFLESVPSDELMTAYCQSLRSRIVQEAGLGDQPLAGMKIVVDAGNGAGGFFVDRVLRPLGADTNGSRYLEPDGRFPNHVPNPEDASAMASIQQAVLQSGADLGIVFDTDVDRAAAVDKSGRAINKDGIVALAAALIADQNPGTTVVTDSVTSDHLTAYLAGLGLAHRRFKRGYRNVINEAIRLNAKGVDSALAIETSGHCAYRDNYFLDDGAFLSVKIIARAARLHREGSHIGALVAALPQPMEDRELRIRIRSEEFKAVGQRVLAALEQKASAPGSVFVPDQSFEGVRVQCPNEAGWALLRLSLHEPLLVLNIQSDRQGGATRIGEQIGAVLSKFAQELDLPSRW